jgi:hypothetical protein
LPCVIKSIKSICFHSKTFIYFGKSETNHWDHLPVLVDL